MSQPGYGKWKRETYLLCWKVKCLTLIFLTLVGYFFRQPLVEMHGFVGRGYVISSLGTRYGVSMLWVPGFESTLHSFAGTSTVLSFSPPASFKCSIIWFYKRAQLFINSFSLVGATHGVRLGGATRDMQTCFYVSGCNNIQWHGYKSG